MPRNAVIHCTEGALMSEMTSNDTVRAGNGRLPSAELLAEIDHLITAERRQLQSEATGEEGEMPQEEYEHEWMIRISLADLAALRALAKVQR